MDSTENKNQLESSKRSPFDELSREELIAKCKGLLAIAQKARQSKQEVLNEIDEYKIKLAEYEKEKKNSDENLRTLQEFTDLLSEQKLNYITALESAENKIKKLNQKCSSYDDVMKKIQDEIMIKDKNNADTLLKLSNLDSENISIKRQKKRLEEENEQLLTQLSELEARIEDFNNIGLQQREQLKILEEKIQPEEKYKSLIEELSKINTELEHKLQTPKGANDNKCPNQLASYENSIKEITELYETEKVNHERCNIKLRSYRDKISKCAACINQLKNSRFILSKTVKEYSETIPKWRNDIITASVVLDGQIKELSEENMNVKEKLSILEEQIKRDLFDINLLRSEIGDLQSRNNDLSDINCKLTKDIELLRDNNQLNNSVQYQEAQNDANVLKGQLNEINDKHEALLEIYSDIQKELQNVYAENVRLKEFSENTSSRNKNIEGLQLQIKALESEKSILVKEKLNARDHAVELDDKNHTLTNQVNEMESDIKNLNIKLNELEKENSILKNNNKSETDDKINKLKYQIALLQEQYDILKKENESMTDINGLLKEEVETLKLSLEQPKDEFDNMSELNVSLQADIVKLDTKLLAYKQENSSLLAEVKELRSKIKDYDSLVSEHEDAKMKLSGYKTENSELLSEMKEINQVLKERGESISKLQKAVAEMERLIDTLEKDRDVSNEEKEDLRKSISMLEYELNNAKVQTNHSNDTAHKLLSEHEDNIKSLADKDRMISSLKDEIEKLKQQQQCSVDFTNEDMSTSTISKTEEHARMRDLDETFEEKYTKLRIFALKLKKKLNETLTQLQNSEKDKERLTKLLADAKITAAVASSDEVDQGQKEVKEDGSQKLISDLEKKVEALTATVASTENIGKELEALKVEVTNLTQKLSAEVEAHKLTKDNLEKARRDVKKKNVLSLEMEDYERSMKELTSKMEENKKKIVQMESTIDTQEGTIASMKVQINLLEEQIKSEEAQNRLVREELQTAMNECREKDNVIQAKNRIISKLEQDLEDEKRKSEESNMEVTSLLSDKEKIIIALAQDKTDLNNKMKRIESKCTELSDQLNITKIELEDLKVEYANYKVRAQAVLRQNQTVDHSHEERLKEEAAAFKAQIETLTAKLASVRAESAEAAEEAAGARRRASETAGELARAQQRSARLHVDLARLTQQLDAERAHHQLQVTEGAAGASETAGELAHAQQRSARLHADLARLTQQLDAERAHHQLQVTEGPAGASETAGELARAQQRSARLHADLARLTQQLDAERAHHQLQVTEGAAGASETAGELARLTQQLDAERAHHQLQVSTLTQCYKTQMGELEMRLHKEMDDLRSKLALAQENLPVAGSSLSDDNRSQYVVPVIPKEDSDGEMDINVSMIPREEGEGSESASPPLKYQPERGGGRSPVPLERLLAHGVPADEAADGAALALSPDQELLATRRKLDEQQQRVKHVTVLLAESERECARLAQLSELLKAELRRGRPPAGAHNAEYVKNVTLKFLTLPPGDERSRLVPVLHKILALSHEEANKIQAVAKGIDPNQKGWGSYLPWPGGK